MDEEAKKERVRQALAEMHQQIVEYGGPFPPPVPGPPPLYQARNRQLAKRWCWRLYVMKFAWCPHLVMHCRARLRFHLRRLPPIYATRLTEPYGRTLLDGSEVDEN